MGWQAASSHSGSPRSTGVEIGNQRVLVWQAARQHRGGGAHSTGFEIGNQRVVVFAGHGAYNAVTDAAPNDWFTVPGGTYIVFWALHGNPFQGSELDARLGSGQFRPQDFNVAQLSSRPQLFGVHRSLPEVVGPGERCRQYRLTPPVGIVLGNVAHERRFITVPDRGPQNIGYRLEDLLAMHQDVTRNATVHWAACRVVKQR